MKQLAISRKVDLYCGAGKGILHHCEKLDKEILLPRKLAPDSPQLTEAGLFEPWRAKTKLGCCTAQFFKEHATHKATRGVLVDS